MSKILPKWKIFAPTLGILLKINCGENTPMFPNGYILGIFLIVTALMLFQSDSSQDVVFSTFLVFLGILSCVYEAFKASVFVQNLLRKFF
ncbi:MAG: hypothetical protein PHR87_10060 [Sulfurospirillaceae bacterium]|nr:hypothetical protein [Sulfurospirillaceae bacterium]